MAVQSFGWRLPGERDVTVHLTGRINRLITLPSIRSKHSLAAVVSPSIALSTIATGRGKLQVQPCPQCPVSDGRRKKGSLS
jgi:hypothetical protein